MEYSRNLDQISKICLWKCKKSLETIDPKKSDLRNFVKDMIDRINEGKELTTNQKLAIDRIFNVRGGEE